MAQKLFEGMRKLSNWSVQRINNHYLYPWPPIGDLGYPSGNLSVSIDDALNTIVKYMPDGGFTPNFNGTFYLQNSSPSGLPSGNDPRGMFGWVRPFVKYPSAEQGLFGYGPTGTFSGYDHNNLFFEMDNSASWRGGDSFNPVDVNNILSPDVDNFIGTTWDGTTLTLYVNNYTWTQTPGSLDTVLGDIRIALGDYWADTLSGLFVGTIVDVGVWGRCPSEYEIAAIIAAGPKEFNELPGFEYGLETSGGDEILCSNGDVLDAFTTVGNGLVSFWNLSESEGTRYDSVGDNNLTPVSL